MPPSRGICLAGHGLRCIRPIPSRLHGTRQLSQSSSLKNVLLSRTPSRPIRSSPLSLSAIGRANISLWPWSKPQDGLGFTPSREGTPDPNSVSPIKAEAPAATNDAVASSASTPAQSLTPPSNANTSLEPTPLPLESVDDAQSLLNAIQTTPITEDHVGFLKEMGVQYGFPYFTNSLQFLMENIHVYAGTEWWATIALSAIAVRAIMFVPFALGSNHTAKLSVINPYLTAAKDKMQLAYASKDPVLQREVSAEMKGLQNAIGLKMKWIWAPMVVQGIAGFCAFKLIRAMAALPVPGLETGGLLWIHDLTIPDPTFVVPIAMAGLLHAIGRMGGETGAGTDKKMTDTMRKMMLYFMPGVMGVVVAFQPAALQVSFLTAMLWGVCQSYLFRQIWFRKAFKMELLPSQINKLNRPSHKALDTAAAKFKTTGAVAAKDNAATTEKIAFTPGPGKLRTVARAPLRYEAPRTQAAGKFAAFQAPPVEPHRAATPPPAPKRGIIDGILEQAATMRKETTAGLGKVIDSARAQTGAPKAKTAREQRAEEYEKRRKAEKREEAEMRRQGRA